MYLLYIRVYISTLVRAWPVRARCTGMAVLINNVVRDTHFPFGQAVWRRQKGATGIAAAAYHMVAATCDNRCRRHRAYTCTRPRAPDVLTAASRKLTLSTTETY